MICLRAKDIEFQVTYIDLTDKPDWFLDISPHGKVPVLVVGGLPLFESNAIAEFLDDVVAPRLHPEDLLKRARNRAWTDYVPTFSTILGHVYYADSEAAKQQAIDEARPCVAKLETALRNERGNNGPYFNGPVLSLVDASYAPFWQRFAMVEEKLPSRLLQDFPLVQGWVDALLAHASVTGSVADNFTEKFITNLQRRDAIAAPRFAPVASVV